MKENQNFGGIIAAPGERQTGWVSVLDTDCQLPVTVINGVNPGQTVLITSAIHGCEYPSIQAVFELAEQTDPADVNGTLVFVNPVNVDAFIDRRPYIVPKDEEQKNLNRCFPGNPEGTLADKIAYVLTEEFQKKVDFHIDTHGGDIPEQQLNYVYYPGMGDQTDALSISEEASDYVLHADFVIKSHATNHAYTHAGIIGVPSLELELGDCGTWTTEEVSDYKENIINVLRWLKVLPGEAVKRQKPALHIMQGIYLDANHSGRWYAFVGHKDKVVKGEKIGEIRDLFGNLLEEYYAEMDGVVLMVCAALGVKIGDPIIAYGA